MQFKLPLLVVEDISRSRLFYEEVLGQKVVLDFGANITFGGGFSLQTLETWTEFINLPPKEILRKANNFELYFEEVCFDDFIVGLQEHELVYLHPVTEYPWGQRVIRFYDPDQHIVEVGESMEMVVKRFINQGMSAPEVAERTQHPLDFVLGCLA